LPYPSKEEKTRSLTLFFNSALQIFICQRIYDCFDKIFCVTKRKFQALT